MKARGPSVGFGALVLSLDFELWWGVRERSASGSEQVARLTGARNAVPRMLELFEEFGVAATWATVGFLFLKSRQEVDALAPRLRPAYRDPRLSPYADSWGSGESDDPFRFAPSLVRAIRRTPRQEIATHTFSHYYCGEEGQTRESFAADIEAARRAAELHDVQLRSIVFPRNQHNPEYDDILLEQGIRAFRGNPRTGSWEFADAQQSRHGWKRLGRLLESYAGSSRGNTIEWSDVPQPSGLSEVRASGMLRPYHPSLHYLERARLSRISRTLRYAARRGRILHLWWHPHNFGVHTDENLAFLRRILEEYGVCRERWGMRSMSMADVDDVVRGEEPVRQNGDGRAVPGLEASENTRDTGLARAVPPRPLAASRAG